MSSNMKKYETSKENCLRKKILFEDPEFLASDSSLYFTKVDRNIIWKRPHELTRDPKFIVEGLCRFDLDQGAIGNCWFIAGAATIATRPDLFSRVVPTDQTFDVDYAGIFRFHFWRYGYWQEVVIDDRLPTYKGRSLYFCSNREQPNEFWAALLEKAYAKVHGSYEALDGGWTQDALVDFTGGLGMSIDLTEKDKLPKDTFDVMLRQQRNNALLGCSIRATKDTMEHELPNGLVIGHAYSITKVTKIFVNGKEIQMVRMRNPWGKKEWNGAWSDRSKEWRSVESETKKALGLTIDNDGEFWMDFPSFLEHFEDCQVCLLPPDCPKANHINNWAEHLYHGSWVNGVSAGGCGNPPHRDLYWTNPQFSIVLDKPDEEDEKYPSDGKCTLVVSLMQKHSRLKRTLNKVESANAAIGFDLYELKTGTLTRHQLQEEQFSKYDLKLRKRSDQYQFYREVSHQFHLDPGAYVIIPSTFHPNATADFLLRTYTEQTAATIEMDTPTGPITKPEDRTPTLKELYKKWSGSDAVIDHRELVGFLNEAYQQELADDHQFTVESARSLLIMMDHDNSGVLEFDEVQALWTELNTWRQAFLTFDHDNSGYIEVSELRSIFKSVGYSVSRKVLAAIVKRYGGKQSRLAFNDLIMVFTKTVALIGYFAKRSSSGLDGKMTLNLDDFIEVAMYF